MKDSQMYFIAGQVWIAGSVMGPTIFTQLCCLAVAICVSTIGHKIQRCELDWKGIL